MFAAAGWHSRAHTHTQTHTPPPPAQSRFQPQNVRQVSHNSLRDSSSGADLLVSSQTPAIENTCVAQTLRNTIVKFETRPAVAVATPTQPRLSSYFNQKCGCTSRHQFDDYGEHDLPTVVCGVGEGWKAGEVPIRWSLPFQWLVILRCAT